MLSSPLCAIALPALPHANSYMQVFDFIDSSRLSNLLPSCAHSSSGSSSLSPSAVHNILKSIINALQYTHQEGVVVRDLSPCNLTACSLGAKGANTNKYEVQFISLAGATQSGTVDDIGAHPLYKRHKEVDMEEVESEEDESSGECIRFCCCLLPLTSPSQMMTVAPNTHPMSSTTSRQRQSMRTPTPHQRWTCGHWACSHTCCCAEACHTLFAIS